MRWRRPSETATRTCRASTADQNEWARHAVTAETVTACRDQWIPLRDALDRRVLERVREDPLGRAHPIQVRRDAAHLEREARAEDHAEVDVLRRLDDVVVGQHAVDLVGQAVLQGAEDLLLRPRVLAAGEDLRGA